MTTELKPDLVELKELADWITNLPIPTRGATRQLIRVNALIAQLEAKEAPVDPRLIPATIDNPAQAWEAPAVVDERPEFEKHFEPDSAIRDYWVHRYRNGDYINAAMQSAWNGWQARAALQSQCAAQTKADAENGRSAQT